jgi:hypothetical protein
VALLVGALLAFAVGLFATAVGLDRDRAFYPTDDCHRVFLCAVRGPGRIHECTRAGVRGGRSLHYGCSIWLQVIALVCRACASGPWCLRSCAWQSHIQPRRTGLVASVLSDVRCNGSRVSGVVAQVRSHSGKRLEIRRLEKPSACRQVHSSHPPRGVQDPHRSPGVIRGLPKVWHQASLL